MKKLLAVLVFVIAVAVGGYYVILQQEFTPTPAPEFVEKAERALGASGAIAMAWLDFDMAVKLERKVYGPDDPSPLASREQEKGTLPAALADAGLDLRDSLHYVLAAAVPHEDGIGAAVLAFGAFDRNKVVRALQVNGYDTALAAKGGYQFYSYRTEDIGTCELSDPWYVHVTPERVVFADPEVAVAVMKELDNAVPREDGADLSHWRSFRKGKVAALGVFAPQNIHKVADNRMVQHMMQAATKKNEAITGLYGGVEVATGLSPALMLQAEVHSGDSAWLDTAVATINEGIDKVEAEHADTLPTLAQLGRYISAKRSSGAPYMNVSVKFDSGFKDDLGNLASEAMQLVFSGFELKTPPGQQGGQAPAEDVMKPEDVTSFVSPLDPNAVGGYDSSDTSFKPTATAGPFGLRVSAARMIERNGKDVAEIEIEAASGVIPNLNQVSMHMMGDDSQAKLEIAQVIAPNGSNVLADESCGRDRNDKPAALDVRQVYLSSGGWAKGLEGKKTVRLLTGGNLDAVKEIRGQVTIDLPVTVTMREVAAPLDGKSVEAGEARVYFKSGDAGVVKYELSGAPSHVLDIRAKNAKGQYLKSNQSSASSGLGGASVSVARHFSGEVASVEVVIAGEVRTVGYPFVLRGAIPEFSEFTWPEPYLVPQTTAEKLAALQPPADPAQYCEDGRVVPDTSVFVLCLKDFKEQWGGVRGEFELAGPYLPSLDKNLGAVRLSVDKVYTAGEDGARVEHDYGQTVYPDLGKETVEGGGDILRGRYIRFSKMRMDDMRGKTVTAIKGELAIRPALKTGNMVFRPTMLGRMQRAHDGFAVRLVALEDGKAVFTFPNGGEDRLVQIAAMDADQKPLSTNNGRLQYDDKAERWTASAQVSGLPTYLYVVYATQVGGGVMPFDISLVEEEETQPEQPEEPRQPQEPREEGAE